MKSARSFTQYKDFQVSKDIKNMTTNFTHGPDAIQGIQSESRRTEPETKHKLQNVKSQIINNLKSEQQLDH